MLGLCCRLESGFSRFHVMIILSHMIEPHFWIGMIGRATFFELDVYNAYDALRQLLVSSTLRTMFRNSPLTPPNIVFAGK